MTQPSTIGTTFNFGGWRRCNTLLENWLRCYSAFKFRSTLFKFVLFGGTWVRAKRGGHLLSLLYKERQGQNLPSDGDLWIFAHFYRFLLGCQGTES
jgi:hypothetical protein